MSARVLRQLCPTAWALILVQFLACGESALDLPDDQLFESEHFRYHMRAGDTICPDTLDTLESHFREAQKFLGFEWPVGSKVDYYHYLDEKDVYRTGACPDGARRCARPTRPEIHSTRSADRHELIHGYMSVVGTPHRAYAEGIAELLLCETVARYNAITGDWRVDLFPDEDTRGLYQSASALVHQIIKQFGVGAFLRLYAQSSWNASPDRLGKEFEDALGVSLDEVWVAALRNLEGTNDLPRYCFCDGPRIPTDGSGGVDRCGPPFDGEREFLFELPEGSLLYAETEGIGGNGPHPTSCGYNTQRGFSIEPPFWVRGFNIGRVGAGKYYLTDVTFIRLTSFPTTAADTCAVSPQYTLNDGSFYDGIRIQPHDTTSFYRLAVPTPQILGGVSDQDFYVCADCEAAADPEARCTLARTAFPLGESFSGSVVLIVPPSEKEAWVRFNTEPCWEECTEVGPTCPVYCANR